jgi:glycosyltransferase involved in cell wall biosynthesis
MRLGFDMQAFQSINKIGGIGKYNDNFLTCLFKLYPDNQYILFYNGLYENKRKELRESNNVCSHTIKYFKYNDLNPFNKWLQRSVYRSKSLDLLHILSPFEDHYHTVIANRLLPSKTVITLYDFIPLIFKELYLNSDTSAKLYFDRLGILKTARLLLSISESTRKDAITLFNIPPEKIVNIGISTSDEFYKFNDLQSGVILDVRKKYDIPNKFILTVSNLDHRKNLVRLLRAFSILPDYILKEFSLIVVCNSLPEYIKNRREIDRVVSQKNVKIKFLYLIPDHDLNILYNTCHLFIYASLYEGGGLPVLEAMKCGAPVIASNTSSISEFAGRDDTLFDPKDIDDMVHAIVTVLTNEDFRAEIGEFGQKQSKNYSWENVVKKTMGAYEYVLTS